MDNMQIFTNKQFGNIRVIYEDGKVLFCGADVAKALGYKNSRKALTDHCKGVTKRYTGVQTGTKSDGTPALQNVEMNFIPEGDIYRLAAKSELPGAETFESWVFDEVLPAIRKYGSYDIDEHRKIIAELKKWQSALDYNEIMLGFAETAVRMNKANYEKALQARKDYKINIEAIHFRLKQLIDSLETVKIGCVE